MKERGSEEILEEMRKLLESSNEKLKEQINLNSHDKEISYRYDRRVRSIKLTIVSLTLTATIVAMYAIAYQYFKVKPDEDVWKRFLNVSSSVADRYATASDVEELRSKISLTDNILDNAMRLVGKQGDDQGVKILESSAIKSSLSSLDSRLGVLERSISENPEKALSIPMLRKDLESMAKLIDGNRLALSVELARVYDQQKWMLGGIGAVLIASIGALITALFNLLVSKRNNS